MLDIIVSLAQAGAALFVVWGLALVLGQIFPSRSRPRAEVTGKARYA